MKNVVQLYNIFSIKFSLCFVCFDVIKDADENSPGDSGSTSPIETIPESADFFLSFPLFVVTIRLDVLKKGHCIFVV